MNNKGTKFSAKVRVPTDHSPYLISIKYIIQVIQKTKLSNIILIEYGK